MINIMMERRKEKQWMQQKGQMKFIQITQIINIYLLGATFEDHGKCSMADQIFLAVLKVAYTLHLASVHWFFTSWLSFSDIDQLMSELFIPTQLKQIHNSLR